jgi:hypothetical protein
MEINSEGLLMKTVLGTFFLLGFLISCRPEQAKTDFNILADVPVGDNILLQTPEDTALSIDYSIQADEESQNLKAKISKYPTNGVLKNCLNPENNLSIKCTYIPNKNFNGLDSIEVITWDGDLKAEKPSKIDIEVLPVSDPPIAYDKDFSTDSFVELDIVLPEAIDIDSLKSDLTYQITQTPQNGTISGCIQNKCTYISDQYFEGQDTFKYKVSDENGTNSNIAQVTINVNLPIKYGVESFTQNVNTLNGADIVWVIDNSGSMGDEQAALQTYFSAFINNFISAGKAKFPFNMAITTTDIYNAQAGTIPFRTNSMGNIYDLSSTKAESNFASFRNEFEKAVNVGVYGSGREKSYLSMEKSYNLAPTWFGGNDRLLVYIIVSDEPEQSGSTAEEWVTKFTNLKDKPEKVKIYPIIHPSKDNNQRYQKAVEMTGTKLYNITESFEPILDNISLSVSNQISSYQLASMRSIIASTIKVSVDGSQTTDFTYDAQKRSLKLNNPPTAYSTVKIEYDYKDSPQ